MLFRSGKALSPGRASGHSGGHDGEREDHPRRERGLSSRYYCRSRGRQLRRNRLAFRSAAVSPGESHHRGTSKYCKARARVADNIQHGANAHERRHALCALSVAGPGFDLTCVCVCVCVCMCARTHTDVGPLPLTSPAATTSCRPPRSISQRLCLLNLGGS